MNRVLQTILHCLKAHRLPATQPRTGSAWPLAAFDLSPEERNELYNDLERAFGLDFDDHELSRQRTLGELASYVLHLRQRHRLARRAAPSGRLTVAV